MSTITITRALLRQWHACYSDSAIESLIPVEGLTPLQILNLNIPAADRLWVVLREDVIPAGPLRLLVVGWARGALERERNAGREPDSRLWAACDAAEQYARGDATAAARAAARAAASDAASDATAAAWAAASDAARAAAWTASDAAWTAARDASAAARAASDAAWTAARAARAAARAASDAARDAARAAQIGDVRVLLDD